MLHWCILYLPWNNNKFNTVQYYTKSPTKTITNIEWTSLKVYCVAVWWSGFDNFLMEEVILRLFSRTLKKLSCISGVSVLSGCKVRLTCTNFHYLSVVKCSSNVWLQPWWLPPSLGASCCEIVWLSWYPTHRQKVSLTVE